MQDFDSSTLGKKSAHGVLALISRTFVLNIISFGASLVIFTILTPKQVGIYTAVIAIQRIISFFADFGFGAALVQKKEELTTEDIHTTFTLQFLVTGMIFILVLLLRAEIAAIFRLNSDATWLLVALVFSIFLSSFKMIPSILLERKIHFHRLVFPQIVESLVFNLFLVVLVLKNFGLSSYTWAFLLSGISSIPFYWRVSPWPIGFGIDRGSLRHLKFGLQYQAKNILATIKDDLLTVILTKLLTYSAIGYIGFAQRLSFFIYRYIVDSVTKVTFSAYSRIQEEKELLSRAIEKSLFFVSLIMFPVLTGLILMSPYIIIYFPRWHNKWEPALFSLIFFSLNALVSSLSGILVNLLDSTGRVKTTLRLMVIWTGLTWVLTPLFISFWGYNGVSVASFLVTLTIFYTIYLAKKVVSFAIIKSIYKPVIATFIMGIVLLLINPVLVHNLILIALAGGIGGAVYALSIYLLAGNELKHDLKKIFKV